MWFKEGAKGPLEHFMMVKNSLLSHATEPYLYAFRIKSES